MEKIDGPRHSIPSHGGQHGASDCTSGCSRNNFHKESATQQRRRYCGPDWGHQHQRNATLGGRNGTYEHGRAAARYRKGMEAHQTT